MNNTPKYRKKLIEVALPLDAINRESAREKSIRHGHPSTLHLWWARRPLAACRAVLFSSLVNDPDDDPMYGISEDAAAIERAKLFDLIEELVLWENSNNPDVINRARLEIARSIAANKVADGELEDGAPLVANAPGLPEEQAKHLPVPPPEYTPHDVRFKMPGLKPEQVNHFLAHYAPPVLDPFAGGGSIPLEAQRLGLRAYASDLNPVPVLINKALIEMPPRFAGQSPVNPESQSGQLVSKIWRGAEGLADDVRYYGKWMRDEAEKRIGHLYPKIEVTQQMVNDGRPDLEPYVGQTLTVIAWLWARTVKSPNPAAKGARVPVISSFWLCTKKGKEAYVLPRINAGKISFDVKHGTPNDDFDPSEGTVSRSGAKCLITKSPIPLAYIREQGKEHQLGTCMFAMIAEGSAGRVYLSPIAGQEQLAATAKPAFAPSTPLPHAALGFRVMGYGIDEHRDLFTDRQLMVLGTLASLLKDVRDHIRSEHPHAAEDYVDAIVTYLGLSVSRQANRCSTQCFWDQMRENVQQVFARNALPMIWDFCEANPFSTSSGNFLQQIDFPIRCLEKLTLDSIVGDARQVDARKSATYLVSPMICTDPPYYDNIGYADLSDFFYVWLRECLHFIYPGLLTTMLTPKSDELIAEPARHASRSEATKYFEVGTREVFTNLRNRASTSLPLPVFYAFRQAETIDDQISSTGWEVFLDGIIASGWQITGTLPLRTEQSGGLRVVGRNALASSIVVVCRPRDEDGSMVTRGDFANALRNELPEAIKHLQSGNVAPVDLAQASIGPGMAVFSRYSKVVNADGSPMTVREALQLINQVLDEALIEQESALDAETRFALRWFEQYAMQEGPFGDAETLAKAMAVSVSGVAESGIVKSRAGKVKLLKRAEMNTDWDPRSDSRLTIWETTQHLIRSLEQGGESAAGELLQRVGTANGEIARELAYRLYQTCERKKLAEDARSYNGLVVSWPELVKLSQQNRRQDGQTVLF